MAVEPAASPSLNLPAIQAVLQHPALVVTRPIEWGTVLLGFEQANRYTVCDEAGAVVAQLMEEEGSIGRAIGRQLLRTRRPFTATVLSADGEELLVVALARLSRLMTGQPARRGTPEMAP